MDERVFDDVEYLNDIGDIIIEVEDGGFLWSSSQFCLVIMTSIQSLKVNFII